MQLSMAIIEPVNPDFTPARTMFIVRDALVVEFTRLVSLCESSKAVEHNRATGSKPDCLFYFHPKHLGAFDDIPRELKREIHHPTTKVLMAFLQLSDAHVAKRYT